MSDKPREFWIDLEQGAYFNSQPSKFFCEVSQSAEIVHLIEKSALDQSTKEIAALEALLEKLGSLVEEIRIGKDRPGDWRLWLLRCGWFQQADEVLAMLAEHKMKGSGG